MNQDERVQRALAMLDELHANMAKGDGVHPCDVGDEIGCIIAVLRDGYDPDEERDQ